MKAGAGLFVVLALGVAWAAPGEGSRFDGDFTVVSNTFGVCVIAKAGAHVVSWRPSGKAEVFYRAKVQNFGPDQEVHGGVPICWPWFAKGAGEPMMRKHGLARYCIWTLADVSTERATFTLASDAETKKHWPYDFRLAYTVTVRETLTLSLKAINTGTIPFAVSEALHPYFRTVRCPDAFVGHALLPGDPGRAVVPDPASGRTLRLSATGNAAMLRWNPGAFAPGQYGDIPLYPDESPHYFCIEPLNPIPYVIMPGASHVLALTIAVE